MISNFCTLILVVLMICFIDGPVGMAIGSSQTAQPGNLRCEYLVEPLGLGETSPRLSWVLESTRRGDRQVAYQIIVASSADRLAKDQGDLWDTGKVESDESAHVAYAGKALLSRMRCFWKVRAWCSVSGETDWSRGALWTMGLLSGNDWQAKWIDNHPAESAALAHVQIKIHSATYGPTSASTTHDSETLDVTATLLSLAKVGSVDLTVNNDSMGGDPAHNIDKELIVDYELGGKSFRTTVAEHKVLSIPSQADVLGYFRKSFAARSPIRRATLYVTALGLYEIHLNGQRVGDHVLAPDWTDYDKRVRYQAYDVTSLVRPASNALGAIIANGWYAGHIGNGGFQQYGKKPALLAQLEMTYADGSTGLVVTDGTWKTHPSEVLSSDFMLGETCDARETIAGWDQPGLDETAWTPASVRNESSRVLESQVSPPVRETGIIKPIKVTEPLPGRWTFDMGQNMVGVVRLKISAPAGTTLTLHHAEMLNSDGTIYTTNLRGAPSVDVYICKGGGTETWQPNFTFHGFRYVEVSGLPGKPADDLITGVVLGSDTPRTGSFSCSEPRINQLMSNIQWGQRGNYLSVPTDCPQRDERLGWMGDAEVFVRTATCNADVASFFSKWLMDIDDAQQSDGAFTDVAPRRGANAGTPAWADAGVICPWTMYMAYGDKRILERHLPAMTKWVEWCRTHSNNLIRDDRDQRGGDYGDWLSINADTPKDLIGTAYFAYSTHLVAKAYAAVGDAEQAAKYQKLFEEIRTAFNNEYVTPNARILGNTQCCYAMALKFELLPDNLRPRAAQHLVDDIEAKGSHLSTGFVGVSYLLPTLAEADHLQVAYKLLMQDTFPSWLFSVKQGATTIWERWDGWTPDKGFQDPGMNSFNHYSLGSCGEWLYDTVAGINWDSDHPGYKHIIIRPLPGGGLTWARATMGSVYGEISSAWKLNGGHLTLDVQIPANTTATVYIPATLDQEITESGKPAGQAEGVRSIGEKEGSDVYEVQSGRYSFEVR
jgi:alpha-L-rhamnosidase